MLCEKCKKNNATVLYKQTVNGKSEQYALCSDCTGKVSFGGFFDDDFNFFGSMFEKKTNEREQVCNLCGATYAQIAKEGKVGCSKCYEVFADRLRPSIERIHGNTKHVGKKPKDAVVRDDRAEKLNELRTRLSAAIADERFEEAAKLRDEIKEMEA